jgi:hypothetical protein
MILYPFVGLLVLAAPPADWPGFLGPERNGVSNDVGPVAAWSAKGPSLIWQQEVGEG